MSASGFGWFLLVYGKTLAKPGAIRGRVLAKRFTDTTKWDDDWYLGLPPRIKCAWDYLCDNCDGAGVLKISFSLISFRIGETVTKEEFDQHFGERLAWISIDKLWVVGFIAFQYKTLSIKNHAHRGIMEKIIRLADGLPLTDGQMTLIRGWKESLLTLKDIGLGKRKEIVLEEECEEEIEKVPNSVYEAVYLQYPKKVGKSDGLKRLKKLCPTLEKLAEYEEAQKAYVAKCKANDTFFKNFDSFVNSTWKDCLDPSYGSVEATGSNAMPNLDHIDWDPA